MKQSLIKIEEKSSKKALKKRPNIYLLIIVSLLLLFGSLMIFSAGYPHAKLHYGDGFYYIKRHFVFLIIGVSIMIFLSCVKITVVKKISPFFYGVCALLLVAVLFTGFSEGVAKRWLGIPGTPLSFQPSELMKLGIILMLSWYIEKTKSSKRSVLKEIILPGVILFSACGLVLLEKHLSGTVILAMIGASVLFISGINLKRAGLIYGGTGVVGASVFLLTNSYAMKRIESFFNPNADILSDKWQTTQGLYAIGSGGLWGLGYFNSRQKYSYVSEPQNDFIFTIWCEEMGFEKITNIEDLQAGDIIFVRPHADGGPQHTFMLASDYKDGSALRYDHGSDSRIMNKKQPTKEPISYGDAPFMYAYRPVVTEENNIYYHDLYAQE